MNLLPGMSGMWRTNWLTTTGGCRLSYGKGLYEERWTSFPTVLTGETFSGDLNGLYRGISEPPERRYVRWICFFDNEMKGDLYTPAFNDLHREIDSVDLTVKWYEQADAEQFLDRTLFVDVMSYLPEDLLVKVDIASMAHSLEARSPFLDHKVMEFAASLPADLKLRGMETKYLLKHTLSDIVPQEILQRRKMGFGVPLDVWFRNDLKEMAYDVLLDQKSIERGYFRKEYALRKCSMNTSRNSTTTVIASGHFCSWSCGTGCLLTGRSVHRYMTTD